MCRRKFNCLFLILIISILFVFIFLKIALLFTYSVHYDDQHSSLAEYSCCQVLCSSVMKLSSMWRHRVELIIHSRWVIYSLFPVKFSYILIFCLTFGSHLLLFQWAFRYQFDTFRWWLASPIRCTKLGMFLFLTSVHYFGLILMTNCIPYCIPFLTF